MLNGTGIRADQTGRQPSDPSLVTGRHHGERNHDDLSAARGLALSLAISALVFAAIGWGVHLLIW
jgi:hypothetical protein